MPRDGQHGERDRTPHDKDWRTASEAPLSPCWYREEFGDYMHDPSDSGHHVGFKRLPRGFDHAFEGGAALREPFIQWEPEMGFDVVAPWPPEGVT